MTNTKPLPGGFIKVLDACEILLKIYLRGVGAL